MNRRRDQRLDRIERAAASSIGASVDDTLWLVQRSRSLQELLRETDRVFASVDRQLRGAGRAVTECRHALDRETP